MLFLLKLLCSIWYIANAMDPFGQPSNYHSDGQTHLTSHKELHPIRGYDNIPDFAGNIDNFAEYYNSIEKGNSVYTEHLNSAPLQPPGYYDAKASSAAFPHEALPYGATVDDPEWNQFKDKYPKIAKLQLSDSDKQTLIAIAKEYAETCPTKPGTTSQKTKQFQKVYEDMIKDASIPQSEMMDLFGLTQSAISKKIKKIKEEHKRKAKEGQQP